MAETTQCDEAERLWIICLNAGIVYRDSERMELISLLHREALFRRFEGDLKLAWYGYFSAKADLEGHLVNHGCWKHAEVG
jgi:hypothetical protein